MWSADVSFAHTVLAHWFRITMRLGRSGSDGDRDAARCAAWGQESLCLVVAAGVLCGVVDRCRSYLRDTTVRRIVAAHEASSSGGQPVVRKNRGHNYDQVIDLVARMIDKTHGRISASGCCLRRAPPAIADRHVTPGGWSPCTRRAAPSKAGS